MAGLGHRAARRSLGAARCRLLRGPSAPAAAPVTFSARRLLAAMLLGVVLYAAFVFYAGYQQMALTLGAFEWSALALTLGLSSSNYALRFLKWQYYLRRLDVRGIATGDSALIFLSGFVLSVTPGTHGVPLERTAPIVVAERLTDVIAVILLVVIGSSGFGAGLYWAALGAFFVALGLLVILWDAPARRFFAALSRVPRLEAWVPRLTQAYASLRVVASLKALGFPVVVSLLAWGLEGIGLHVLLHGFGASLPLSFSLFFYATATLAGAIIPVPGGLGVTEALMQEQLVHIGGAAPAVATASMILIRLCTLWWAVAVGFMALGILRLKFPSLAGPKTTGTEAPRAA
jgi:uncharacterized protein (TIRG00374 family)